MLELTEGLPSSRPFGAYSGASPESIQYHYDVSDDFFRLWLGASMTYTAGRFDDGMSDALALAPGALDAAQDAKIRFHLAALGTIKGRRILDIGCGWGTLMRRSVQELGASGAFGLTLSKGQRDYIERQGTPGVSVSLESWEHFEPPTQFDGVVSVGAFEHFVKPSLGRMAKLAVYRHFFEMCHRCLKEGGRLSLQTIAWGEVAEERQSEIPMQQFFPDSDLPYIDEVAAASRGLFEVVTLENRRRDYELTLRNWLASLRAQRAAAIDLVGQERYTFYDRCLQGGVRLFQRRKYYLCRFVFVRCNSDSRTRALISLD